MPEPEKIPELEFDKEMRAKADTARMVREIKAGMRNKKFPDVVEAIKKRSVKRAELRAKKDS